MSEKQLGPPFARTELLVIRVATAGKYCSPLCKHLDKQGHRCKAFGQRMGGRNPTFARCHICMNAESVEDGAVGKEKA